MSGSSELRYGTETPAEGYQGDREDSLNGVEARIVQNPYLTSLVNGDIHLFSDWTADTGHKTGH